MGFGVGLIYCRQRLGKSRKFNLHRVTLIKVFHFRYGHLDKSDLRFRPDHLRKIIYTPSPFPKQFYCLCWFTVLTRSLCIESDFHLCTGQFGKKGLFFSVSSWRSLSFWPGHYKELSDAKGRGSPLFKSRIVLFTRRGFLARLFNHCFIKIKLSYSQVFRWCYLSFDVIYHCDPVSLAKGFFTSDMVTLVKAAFLTRHFYKIYYHFWPGPFGKSSCLSDPVISIKLTRNSKNYFHNISFPLLTESQQKTLKIFHKKEGLLTFTVNIYNRELFVD